MTAIQLGFCYQACEVKTDYQSDVSTSATLIPPDLIQDLYDSFILTLTERQLRATNGRLDRGRLLALSGRLVNLGVNLWQVPSSHDHTKTYLVDLESKTCTCPDSQAGFACKHRFAAWLITHALKRLAEQSTESPLTPPTEPLSVPFSDLGAALPQSRPTEPSVTNLQPDLEPALPVTDPPVDLDILESFQWLGVNATPEQLQKAGRLLPPVFILADFTFCDRVLRVEILESNIAENKVYVQALMKIVNDELVPVFPFVTETGYPYQAAWVPRNTINNVKVFYFHD